MLLWKMGNGSEIIQSTCIRIHIIRILVINVTSVVSCPGWMLNIFSVCHISCVFLSLEFPTRKVWAVVAFNFGLRRMV